jgi:hypothetical protein
VLINIFLWSFVKAMLMSLRYLRLSKSRRPFTERPVQKLVKTFSINVWEEAWYRMYYFAGTTRGVNIELYEFFITLFGLNLADILYLTAP